MKIVMSKVKDFMNGKLIIGTILIKKNLVLNFILKKLHLADIHGKYYNLIIMIIYNHYIMFIII